MLEEKEVERLLYIVPAVVLILAVIGGPSKETVSSVVFMGLLSSAALYFLGFPAPAAASLVGSFLASLMLVMELEPWRNFSRAVTVTEPLIKTYFKILTVTNEVVRTSLATLISRITKTVTVTTTIFKTTTITSISTEFLCAKVIKLTNTWEEGPLPCPQVLYCSGPKDVLVYYGTNLTLSPYLIMGKGATVIYTPQGTWSLARCNRTVTLTAGETLALARPYYGQPPVTVTLVRMTTESR